MPSIQLTENLKMEYERLFNSCILSPGRINEVDAVVRRIMTNKSRYDSVSKKLNIPWRLIAVIHAMESSLNFRRHLHNGDPLTKPTIHQPKNRPAGPGPFTWEESATDALRMKGLHKRRDWGLAETLYELERYNGFGYRLHHPHVLSPYLWSWTNHYTSGKYIKDGVWSDSAVSKQCGAAALLRRMAGDGQCSSQEVVFSSSDDINVFLQPTSFY